MALIVLADLKTFLGITTGDTSQDSLLNLLISQCSSRIENYCQRTFATTTYTQIVSGNGSQILSLPNRPIISITSIYQDNQAYFGQGSSPFAAATLLTAGTDYALVVDQPDGSSKCGQVLRLNNVWTQPEVFMAGTIDPQKIYGYGNIKAVYVAGYSAVPQDVQQAAMVLCQKVKLHTRIGFPLQSLGWEDYQKSLSPLTIAPMVETGFGVLPKEVVGILSRYRNMSVG